VKVHLEKPKRLPNVWNQVATRNIDDIKKEY